MSDCVPLAARAALRRELRRRRGALSQWEREAAHRRVALLLSRLGRLRPGLRVGIYLPIGSEFDTRPLLEILRRRRCIAYLPRITAARAQRMTFSPLTPNLRRNQHGILEPKGHVHTPAQDLDLILLPLVGFDARGHRLGSGAGYYDRALCFRRRRRCWRGPTLIGIAYECQRVAALAARPTDIPLDAVITERGIAFFIGEIT